jgi:diguanylate cyclase (GGDEF)-like protein/PAS domain S-box-containing protein
MARPAHNSTRGTARFAVAVLVVALMLGVAAASVANRLQKVSERQWRAVSDAGDLGRNLETLQALRARSLSVNDSTRLTVSFTADYFGQEIVNALARLEKSDLLPTKFAVVKNQVVDYQAKVLAEVSSDGPRVQAPLDEVLDPRYVPVREAVAKLVEQITNEAVKSGRTNNLLTWAFYPMLLLGSGLIVLRNARNRRIAVQQTTEKRESAKFEAMVGTSRDVITVVNANGQFAYISPAASKIFGLSVSELMESGPAALLQTVDLEHFGQADAQVRETDRTMLVEAQVTVAGGVSRFFEIAGSNAHNSDLTGTLWTWHDIHDRKTLENELKHQAFHDPLTSLANRALFQNRLEFALAQSQRTGASTSLLFIDLDGFKNVNDSLGHDTGDAVLCRLATSIAAVIRPGDTLARLGGDEFAILLEATDQCTAAQLAEQVLAATRESFSLPVPGEAAVDVSMSASIGVASAVGDATSIDLLRNADIAMYSAKHTGKNCVRVYSNGMHEVATDRLRLQSEMRRAIANDEFRLHYQPLVELATGEVIGFEGLVRWEHPVRGLLAPFHFIPIAEETDAIVDIGRVVIATAARDAAILNRNSVRPLKVNVNVSPKQLVDANLVPVLAAALRDNNLDPSLLVVEITETALLDETGDAVGVLEQIRALGIKLALDDFGTGFSTLSSLRSLPIDIVKVDRSFISNIDNATDGRSRLLTESIVAMSRQLGLETVAEGIETTDQLDRVRALGCDVGQGYLFSRPVALDAVDRAIADIHAQFANLSGALS